MKTYDERVRAYEAEGMTRSDAQGIVDLEDMRASKEKNAMTQTRTPGPWEVDKYSQITTPTEEVLLVSGVALPSGNHPRIAEAEANAAFIVRACNAHEQLVKALEKVRIFVNGDRSPANMSTATFIIDKALALARGKE
jgi:hypothetical protein